MEGAAALRRGVAGYSPRHGRLLGLAALGLLALCCCLLSAAAAWAGPDKVVRYRGYRLVVPASWPVYQLSSHPNLCVRFDRHAVYLGQPGSSQRCPANAVGRTEAILVQPLAAHGARAQDTVAPALSPVTNSEAQPGQGSSAEMVVKRAGLMVTATWNSHPGTVARALGRPLAALAATNRASVAHAASRPPAAARAASAAASGFYTGLGFDPCATPSAAQMSAWSESPYRAVGVYVGGTNMACAQPNLTTAWVNAESAAGWRLIPTYVGLQAPQNECGCAAINARRASAEGAAAARDAVNRASAVGIGPGNPIYFDMENYARGGSNTSAVLTFLEAWTAGLHAAGYKSGVYSNADSGISDLVAAKGSGSIVPDDIWMAEWNGERNVASPYVPGGDWNAHRLHQYEGGHNQTFGGVTINIDSDFLDGETASAGVASATAAIPNGTFVREEGSPVTYEIAGGAPLYVSPQYWATLGPRSVMPISQRRFNLLNEAPVNGTLLQDPSGEVYRVAGGAPLYVSNPNLFAGAHPVAIDEWDIANANSPAAHLRAAPANGTFVTTTAGQVYRIAGGAPFAVTRWSLFGGVWPSVTIDQWDVSEASNPAAHLSPQPAYGTLVEGLPSHSYWVFADGLRRLASASPGAVQVDDSGLAVYPAVPCVVPDLQQLTLRQARSALMSADCRLGAVNGPRPTRSSRAQHVITQEPQPQTTEEANYAVAVSVG
jgi:hypothetical protein